jgi:hypothetical protein
MDGLPVRMYMDQRIGSGSTTVPGHVMVGMFARGSSQSTGYLVKPRTVMRL